MKDIYIEQRNFTIQSKILRNFREISRWKVNKSFFVKARILKSVAGCGAKKLLCSVSVSLLLCKSVLDYSISTNRVTSRNFKPISAKLVNSTIRNKTIKNQSTSTIIKTKSKIIIKACHGAIFHFSNLYNVLRLYFDHFNTDCHVVNKASISQNPNITCKTNLLRAGYAEKSFVI